MGGQAGQTPAVSTHPPQTSALRRLSRPHGGAGRPASPGPSLEPPPQLCRAVPCRRAPPSDRGPAAGPCTLCARGGGEFDPPPAVAAALGLCCEGCTPAACPRGRSAQVTGLAGRFLRLLRGARVPAWPLSRGGAPCSARSASPPPRPSPPPAGPAPPRAAAVRAEGARRWRALVCSPRGWESGKRVGRAEGYAARSAKWCQLGGRGHRGQLLLRGEEVTGGARGVTRPSKPGSSELGVVVRQGQALRIVMR